MNITVEEIDNIFKRLEEDLKCIVSEHDNSTLINISAEFKEIKEVIQYFETSIDSLRTQNENLKDIISDTVKELINTKKKMLNGMITKEELSKELSELATSLKTTKSGKMDKIKKYISSISPKMMIIIVAIILFLLFALIEPKVADDTLHTLGPAIIKKL